MKTERELFERQMNGTFGNLVDLRAREGTGFSYMDWGTQVAWAMWQARVPEGYVVVPKEPTERMLDAARRRQWDDLSSPLEDMDMLKYKAMLEAVEK